MAGPAPSIALVPLRDVLSYPAAEDDVRRLAGELERHPAAAGRTAWHWFPGHTQRPPTASERVFVQQVSVGITGFGSSDDDIELLLDIGWGPELSVTASAGVACRCPRDHGTHYLREDRWPVASRDDLVEAFTAGTAMLTEILDSGIVQHR